MITFNNYKYINEHGKAPRGLGMWAFYSYINESALRRENCPFEYHKIGRYTLIWASKPMLLSEAKKELKNWLTSKGYKNELIFVAD